MTSQGVSLAKSIIRDYRLRIKFKQGLTTSSSGEHYDTTANIKKAKWGLGLK